MYKQDHGVTLQICSALAWLLKSTYMTGLITVLLLANTEGTTLATGVIIPCLPKVAIRDTTP